LHDTVAVCALLCVLATAPAAFGAPASPAAATVPPAGGDAARRRSRGVGPRLPAARTVSWMRACRVRGSPDPASWAWAEPRQTTVSAPASTTSRMSVPSLYWRVTITGTLGLPADGIGRTSRKVGVWLRPAPDAHVPLDDEVRAARLLPL